MSEKPHIVDVVEPAEQRELVAVLETVDVRTTRCSAYVSAVKDALTFAEPSVLAVFPR